MDIYGSINLIESISFVPGLSSFFSTDEESPSNKRQNPYIRFMQRVLAFLLFAICSPLLMLIILLVWLIEWEHPFFFQERIGLDMEPFTIYKLRTMKHQKITFLGRILRKTGIDELPQLLNIVSGTMNFVGPRPLTAADIERLGWNDDRHRERWSVKPGITGLAQFTTVCDAEVSWQNDQHYLNNRSTALDIKIVWKSLLIPFLGKSSAKKLIYKSPTL